MTGCGGKGKRRERRDVQPTDLRMDGTAACSMRMLFGEGRAQLAICCGSVGERYIHMRYTYMYIDKVGGVGGVGYGPRRLKVVYLRDTMFNYRLIIKIKLRIMI
jgi:hypothetical protein